MDLGKLYAERRFVTILELIDELPGSSRTNSAIVNDADQAPLIAKQMAEREKEQGKVEWKPDTAEWTLLHELLAQIRDTLVRVNSEKPKTVKEFPRPDTAVAAELRNARKEVAEANTRDLVAQLTPWAVT